MYYKYGNFPISVAPSICKASTQYHSFANSTFFMKKSISILILPTNNGCICICMCFDVLMYLMGMLPPLLVTSSHPNEDYGSLILFNWLEPGKSKVLRYRYTHTKYSSSELWNAFLFTEFSRKSAWKGRFTNYIRTSQRTAIYSKTWSIRYEQNCISAPNWK